MLVSDYIYQVPTYLKLPCLGPWPAFAYLIRLDYFMHTAHTHSMETHSMEKVPSMENFSINQTE